MMRTILITTLLFLLPVLAFGQERTITLEEAIQIALENNFELKQAENDLDLSNYRVRSAKADFLPDLNANSNRGRRIGRQFDETTGDFGDFTVNTFGVSTSTSVTIFDGFSNINSLRSSRHEKLSREENLKRVRENIIFTTASRYLQYILDTELLEISQENLETSLRQLEQVEAQVEVGSRPTVDLLNQESIVANNELQVVFRENDVQFSRLQLIRTLQIDPLEEYNFVVPDVDDMVVIPQEYSLQELVAAALENRSDLRSEEESIRAAMFDLKVARANFYPSLSLNASVSTSFSDINPLSFSDQITEDNIVRQIGLSLSIPIFNRLNVRESVRAQEISFKNAELSLENTRLNVVQEVNQAYNDYIALVKELESTEKAFIAAERAFETEQQRYEVGATTLIELSQANNAYIEAHSNRIQTMYNFVFQEKLLDYYIGRLDEAIEF